MSQSIIPPEVYRQAFQSLEEGQKILAPILMETAKQTWSSGIVLPLLLLMGLDKLLAGKIGSLIYNTIYFGILGAIIAAKGFEILFDPYLDIICLLLYRGSYFLTGRILDKIRHRRH